MVAAAHSVLGIIQQARDARHMPRAEPRSAKGAVRGRAPALAAPSSKRKPGWGSVLLAFKFRAFRASALRAAHLAGGEATDDAALVEAAGGVVVVVAGEPTNRKITDPDDLEWARRVVGRWRLQGPRPTGARGARRHRWASTG